MIATFCLISGTQRLAVNLLPTTPEEHILLGLFTEQPGRLVLNETVRNAVEGLVSAMLVKNTAVKVVE